MEQPRHTDLVRRYVTPGEGHIRRYLKLLHGNFTRLEDEAGERSRFLQSLAGAARQVTDQELTALLWDGVNWRPRLTAAWLIGIDRREQFRDDLGRLLLESQVCYAGQGYCFALARFRTPADADLLVSYLDRYLRRPECRYDQAWAIGALLHIDARSGTDHSGRFLVPDGLWQRWADGRSDAAAYMRRIDELCGLVDQYASPGRQ